MTASTITIEPGRFAGLKPLVRKDLTEWLRGRRAWVVLATTTILMTLTAAGAWINTTLQEAFPAEGGAVDGGPVSMAPLDNLAAAVGAQFFILVVIFSVASLVIRERESGTLAWVASKPVSRGSILAAKLISAAGMLALTAAIVPLAATVAVVVAVYGAPDPVVVIAIGLGMAATVVFFSAVGLAAGTVMPGQAAVAATGFAVFALPLLLGIFPPLLQFVPSSILPWAIGLASGADVGFVTPIGFVAITAALVAFAIRRLDRLEL